MKGKRFAFMDTFTKETPKLLGTRREFKQHGKSGTWVSELLPHIAGIVDDIAYLSRRSRRRTSITARPRCSSTPAPRGSAGRAWAPGSPTASAANRKDLPGFVVLQSGPRGPRGGAALWGSGFLPTTYQGVPFRSGGDPILEPVQPEGHHAANAAARRSTPSAI